MPSSQKIKPSLKVNILVYHEDDEWIAHCLEMDLVATGKTEKAVKEDIIALIREQIIFAFENDNVRNLYKSAPAEDWERLQHLKYAGSSIIKFDEEKKKDHQPPINKVELCFA